MLSNQEAALLEAASIVRETKTLATHITFQLDFMLLMLNAGRTDEANDPTRPDPTRPDPKRFYLQSHNVP